MQEITQWNPGDVEGLLPLFRGLHMHLAVSAVLQGAAAGRVWVDATARVANAVIWTAHRVYVAGTDAGALHGVIQEIAAEAQARGDWGVGVYGAEQTAWEEVLGGLQWRNLAREYWEGSTAAVLPAESAPPQDPGAATVGGLRLRTVDTVLLGEPWAGLDQLREEMCSERATVADFLARSFGVCLVNDSERALAAWCLSEYNCDARCEVGIEVVEAYQRRGLGTGLARALCAEAAARGVERVGWHCLAANTASGATARAAGLALVARYTGAVVLLGAGA